MKNFAKLACLILALTMVLPLLASCGDSSSPSATTEADTTGADSAPTDEATDAADERIPSSVPVKDFGGYEYRILGNSLEYHEHWYSRDLYAEEQTGDTINDAIYLRNTAIEDMYNVKIKVNYSQNPASDAQKSIKAGDDLYDLLSIQLEGSAQILAQGGYLYDLKQIPHVDLTKPWWDQKAKEQLTMGGKLYTTVSDLSIVDKDAVFIYLFNKDLIRDYGLDDPYRLIEENNWTVDKMYEMARSATRDVDGNSVIDENDCYGFLAETNTFYELVLGANELFIKKDANDNPVPDFANSRLVQSFNKWIEVYNDRNTTMMANDFNAKYPGNEVWDLQLDMLNTKRALFLYTGMNRVTMLRQMDCNFGILPVPKLNSDQAEYSNAVHPWCATSVSIPVTVFDLERSALLLEALTRESYYTLRPAYYDVSLKSKLIRDEESRSTMDIIFATRTYDLGHVFNFGSIFNVISDLAIKKDVNYTSAIEKNEGKVITAIEKSIQGFEETAAKG